MFRNGIVISTPRRLNTIFIVAIVSALFRLNVNEIVLIINVNGEINTVNINTVKILNNIEKCANFLLSLLPFIKAINPSKLVPIFAPKINGMVSIGEIKEDIENICKILINKDDDCRAIVNKVPINRLKKKLLVDNSI